MASGRLSERAEVKRTVRTCHQDLQIMVSFMFHIPTCAIRFRFGALAERAEVRSALWIEAVGTRFPLGTGAAPLS